MQETRHSRIYSPTTSHFSACEAKNPFTVFRPPPWFLEGEAWWMILSFLGPSRELLEGVKHQLLEESKHFGLAPWASFEPIKGLRGGIGNVQIIRYHMSLVGQSPMTVYYVEINWEKLSSSLTMCPWTGPYDELLIVPGAFKPPPGCPNQSPGLRVTQIYVSSLESVLNGQLKRATVWQRVRNIESDYGRKTVGRASELEHPQEACAI